MTNQAQAELTDISGSGFLNLHTREYDDELLEFFGLEEIRDALPPLVKATDICGYVTEKAAERAGKTVPGNDPDDVYGIKRRLFGGQCHPGLQKRSGADVWKRGHDRSGDRVYGSADGDEPSGGGTSGGFCHAKRSGGSGEFHPYLCDSQKERRTAGVYH